MKWIPVNIRGADTFYSPGVVPVVAELDKEKLDLIFSL